MAGARAVGAAGRVWGSSYAGSAGRHSCVRVGTKCSPPAVRGAPVARLGALLPPAALLLGAVGARCPPAVGKGVRVRDPALSPWPVFPGGGEPSPGGLARHCCEACLVSGAVPLPAARPLGWAAGVPRPVCSGCGRCGRGDPATVFTACALAGRRCSLWGWRKGVPGGGAFNRREGRLRSGAPPLLTVHPLGMLLASVTPMLRARACGCWGPSRSPWPACPHLGFYGVQKSQNQLQSESLLFLSNYTIKSIFSGVSPPPPPSKLEIFQPLDRQCRLDCI